MVLYVQYYTEPVVKIVYYCSYRPQPLYEGQRPALAEIELARGCGYWPAG